MEKKLRQNMDMVIVKKRRLLQKEVEMSKSAFSAGKIQKSRICTPHFSGVGQSMGLIKRIIGTVVSTNSSLKDQIRSIF